MKTLGEKDSYRFDEKNGDGYLYVSAIEKGVQLMLRGYTPTRSGFVAFGLSPEEAGQLAVAADVLVPLVPTIEQARRMHEVEMQNKIARHKRIFPDQPAPLPAPFEALAPVVHEIVFEEDSDKKAELVGGKLEPEEMLVIGGLTWAREQLLLRFDEVDTLVFRPDAFVELARIGSEQPEFPATSSIWSRTNN